MWFWGQNWGWNLAKNANNNFLDNFSIFFETKNLTSKKIWAKFWVKIRIKIFNKNVKTFLWKFFEVMVGSSKKSMAKVFKKIVWFMWTSHHFRFSWTKIGVKMAANYLIGEIFYLLYGCISMAFTMFDRNLHQHWKTEFKQRIRMRKYFGVFMWAETNLFN